MRESKCPPKEVVDGFRGASTGDLSDVLDSLGIRGVAVGIFPVVSGVKVAGCAVTVKQGTKTSPDMGKTRHGEVVDKIAGPGDVIVIDVGGRLDCATSGSEMCTRAQRKKIEAIVIDGCTRDVEGIRELRFPMFARSICPAASAGRLQTLYVNEPVQLGGVSVKPGDIVVGDEDGVVVVPLERAEEVLKKVKEEAEAVKKRIEAYKKGKTHDEVWGH